MQGTWCRLACSNGALAFICMGCGTSAGYALAQGAEGSRCPQASLPTPSQSLLAELPPQLLMALYTACLTSIGLTSGICSLLLRNFLCSVFSGLEPNHMLSQNNGNSTQFPLHTLPHAGMHMYTYHTQHTHIHTSHTTYHVHTHHI